jgi:hypothetical protein
VTLVITLEMDNLPLQLALLVLEIKITDEESKYDACCYDVFAPSW